MGADLYAHRAKGGTALSRPHTFLCRETKTMCEPRAAVTATAITSVGYEDDGVNQPFPEVVAIDTSMPKPMLKRRQHALHSSRHANWLYVNGRLW
jgi:hypothetical protein